MRILFLGGTSFVGRHTVEAALERGHEVAFLHRGHTGADLHPAAERIVADRKADLGALAGRTFDAVIDTSGYFPADVERSTAALRESAGRYLFVSTRSVYADTSTPGLTETAALAELPPAEPTDAITGENYRPPESAVRGCCPAGLRGSLDHPAAGSDRRPIRSDRPVCILAGAGRRGRRRAVSRAPRAACSGDRRP